MQVRIYLATAMRTGYDSPNLRKDELQSQNAEPPVACGGRLKTTAERKAERGDGKPY